MRAGTSEGRRGRLFAIESLAGWVFADMLLVLFLVGIASAVPLPEPEPTPTPTPEPTSTPTPTPTPEPPEIIGMRTEPETFSISFDAGALLSSSEAAAESVCRSLREESRPIESERAAFVLIFGGTTEPTTGQEIARRISDQLQCADDALFPAGTVVRPYWDGSLPSGRANLEVFTFTTDQSETSDTKKE